MDVFRAPIFKCVLGSILLLSGPLAAQEASEEDQCSAIDAVYADIAQKSCGEMPQTCEQLKSFDSCVEKIFMSSLNELSTSTKAILQAGRDASGKGPFKRCLRDKRQELSCAGGFVSSLKAKSLMAKGVSASNSEIPEPKKNAKPANEVLASGAKSQPQPHSDSAESPDEVAAPQLAGQTPAPPLPASAQVSLQGKHSLQYAQIPGVDPSLLSLDIYGRPGVSSSVLAYVHGGSWKGGDKTNIAAKLQLADELGAVFVSINYRLSPKAKHPDHVKDIAAALVWIKANAKRFGGDSSRFAIMGHSAGGHLVSLVGTHPRYLREAGMLREHLSCIVNLDGPTDLRDNLSDPQSENNVAAIKDAFGEDPAVLSDASPIVQLPTLRGSEARYLMIGRGNAARLSEAKSFAAAYNDTTAVNFDHGEFFDANPYSHEDVNKKLGADDKLTPIVLDFLRRCLR
jgi:dienelactone hydrolase